MGISLSPIPTSYIRNTQSMNVYTHLWVLATFVTFVTLSLESPVTFGCITSFTVAATITLSTASAVAASIFSLCYTVHIPCHSNHYARDDERHNPVLPIHVALFDIKIAKLVNFVKKSNRFSQEQDKFNGQKESNAHIIQ